MNFCFFWIALMHDLLTASLKNRISDVVWLLVPEGAGAKRLLQVKAFVWSQNVRMVRMLFPE